MRITLAVALLFVFVETIRAQEPGPLKEPFTYQVRGRVIDAEGKPVANIQVATGWNFQGDSATPRWRSDVIARPGTSLRTDEDGQFSGTLYARRPTVALFALDLELKMGGIFVFSKENPEQECTITIEPLTRLSGRINIGDSKLKDDTKYIYATDPRALIAIASFVSKESQFDFYMPPGRYEMSFSAKDIEKVTLEVALTDEHLDLRTIDLSPTNLARHYGKEPPPWTITDARGVNKDVQLSDYQGKWVLIEFWAYW